MKCMSRGSLSRTYRQLLPCAEAQPRYTHRDIGSSLVGSSSEGHRLLLMASAIEIEPPTPTIEDVYTRDTNKGYYRVLVQIGRGHYSTVWLASHTQTARQQVVAIKIPKESARSNSDFEVNLARQEIPCLAASHNDEETLAKFLLPTETMRIDSLNCTALVFNDLCGPSVHEFAKGSPDSRLPCAMARRAISDVVDAVEFLHRHDIGHGGEKTQILPLSTYLMPAKDIHTWNIQMLSTPPMCDWDLLAYASTRHCFMEVPLDDLAASDVAPMMSFLAANNISFLGAVKLADFGGAYYAEHGGTAKCRVDIKAPERLEGKECSLPSDVWALACTMVEIATGELCFPGPEGVLGQDWTGAMFLDIVDDYVGEQSCKSLEQRLQALLHGCGKVFGAKSALVQLLIGMLRRDPKERFTMLMVTSEASLAWKLENACSQPKA